MTLNRLKEDKLMRIGLDIWATGLLVFVAGELLAHLVTHNIREAEVADTIALCFYGVFFVIASIRIIDLRRKIKRLDIEIIVYETLLDLELKKLEKVIKQ